MRFTAENRYLPLPTSTTLKVLHLGKTERYRLTAESCAPFNTFLTSVNKINKYDLRLKCMLVRCGRPLPDSPLIVQCYQFLANVNSCSCPLYVVVGPSVCLSSVCLSVCLSSVTFVHPTQAIKIFGNVSMPFGTMAICDPSVKILRRSSQGNPSVGGFNQRGVEKCSDFGPFQGYISVTVQDRR